MNTEGGLKAPERHSINWKNPEYYDEAVLHQEMERVFDICHGCRRCVNLCNTFPTLFDLIDTSSTMEIDGVDKKDYIKVVDHCFMCDLCFMSKCPYVPPHEWNVDFPKLMLRAKAIKAQQSKIRLRDRILSSTDAVAKVASFPVVNLIFNSALKNKIVRKVLEKTFGIDAQAKLPQYYTDTAVKKYADKEQPLLKTNGTSSIELPDKVALFTTCYGNYNDPALIEDMLAVFEHNQIACTLIDKAVCCGMPKFEIGNLDQIEKLKQKNAPLLMEYVNNGYAVITPMPSCTLMFRQELPLLFPKDQEITTLAKYIFDPCEYLLSKHKQGSLNTEFTLSLGSTVYHVACHQRVQNIGAKTQELLKLLPITKLDVVERCSGHDGVYGVRSESREAAVKIARPIVRKLENADADYLVSDCILAGHHIEDLASNNATVVHPLTLLRKAYSI